MTDETIALLLESAVRKLGPIGAHNALTAFADENNKSTWRACGLAASYGAPGELLDEMLRIRPGCVLSEECYIAAAEIIGHGLAPAEVHAFAAAFDECGPGPTFAPENRVLLRSLLEAEAAKIQTPRAVSPSEATATPEPAGAAS